MTGMRRDIIDGRQRHGHELGRLVPREVHPIQSPDCWPASPPRYDVVVVGAGLAGAVIAERLANQAGCQVLVVDDHARFETSGVDSWAAAGNDRNRRGRDRDRLGFTRSRSYLAGFAGEGPVVSLGDLIVRLLDHPNIAVLLGVDPREARACYAHDRVVFSVPEKWIVLAGQQQAAADEAGVFVTERLGLQGADDVETIVAEALATFDRVLATRLSTLQAAENEDSRIASAA